MRYSFTTVMTHPIFVACIMTSANGLNGHYLAAFNYESEPQNICLLW